MVEELALMLVEVICSQRDLLPNLSLHKTIEVYVLTVSSPYSSVRRFDTCIDFPLPVVIWHYVEVLCSPQVLAPPQLYPIYMWGSRE